MITRYQVHFGSTSPVRQAIQTWATTEYSNMGKSGILRLLPPNLQAKLKNVPAERLISAAAAVQADNTALAFHRQVFKLAVRAGRHVGGSGKQVRKLLAKLLGPR